MKQLKGFLVVLASLCLIVLVCDFIRNHFFKKEESSKPYIPITNDSLYAVIDSFQVVVENLHQEIEVNKYYQQQKIDELVKKYSNYTKLDTRKQLEKFKSEYDSIARYNMR